MIALAGYQLSEFSRTKYWAGIVGGYLIYLVLFFLRSAHHHPGSWGNGGIGLLAVAFGLGWTLAASQDRSRWQILVVATGSRERATASRVLAAFCVTLPFSVLGLLVAAGHKLVSAPLLSLVAALLLYLVIALIGAMLGTEVGRRLTLRSVTPATIAVCLALLLAV
jgi:glucan phosphoethanolaminetransferase (alkaline phosphatase superfamily)